MKLYRIGNDRTEHTSTEVFLTDALLGRYSGLPETASDIMRVVNSKFGKTVSTMIAGSVPGIMNYMVLPATLDSENTLVIDLYVDWQDKAEVLADRRVLPIHEAFTSIGYFLCAPSELKTVLHIVRDSKPSYIDLTLDKESA